MKKLIFLVCFLASIEILSAQSSEGFNKKDMFISGSFGFESNSIKDGSVKTSSSSFFFSPTLGYFISDNIAIGGGLSFLNAPLDVGGDQIDVTSIGVRMLSRYYINPGKKFSPFGQISIGFGMVNPEVETESDFNTFDVGVSPGINYFLNNKFSVEATVGRIGYTAFSANGFSQTNLGLSFDLSNISLGLNFKF
jgi:hypothetical protein